MRTTPRSSRFASDSSERFGMSRVISSSPSFVERASISYSWMWIELSTSSRTSRSEMTIASSKLKPSHGMNATSRFAPSASSPPSVELPSASTSPFFTLSPSVTTGFWWMSVPWFERMNFVSGYSSREPRPSTTIRSASTSTTAPSLRESTTSPVSTAARNSRPVPTSGACGIISGTACFCMFAPMSARFASLCSRNGMSAVATDTICAGETSMYSTSFGSTATASPSRERQRTCSFTNFPVFGSTGSEACAIVNWRSSAASR